jgi:hypothetical protein
MNGLLNGPLASVGGAPLYDLLDQGGRLLLVGVTDSVANHVIDQLGNLPGWTSDFRMRLHRDERTRREVFWDWRYEGPLELLAYSSAVTPRAGVQVRSHVGRCGLEFEEAVRRLGQFTEQHQDILIALMAEQFDFDPNKRPGCVMEEQHD